MTSDWNINRLYNDVICDRNICVQWCEEQGLLPIRRLCTEGHDMLITQSKTSFGQFRCSKKHSTGKAITLSRTRGTVFEGKKISPEKMLIMIYCFAHDFTYHDCILESSIDSGMTSKETVFEFYTFFRELITHRFLEFKNLNKVGGNDIYVEILEFYLSKRKFNVGPYGEDTFIVVMVEWDTKHFCIEVCDEKEWNEENLFPVIKKCVCKGSIIISNQNRDYSILSEEGYIIQNSKDFLSSTSEDCVDSELSPTSNESLQSKKYNVYKGIGADKLLEFLFKCEVKQKHLDPFEAFLDIIRHRFLV